MQKFFSLLLAFIACAGTMFAERVQIGDLYYNLNANDLTAEVTYQEQWSLTNYSYLTAVNIPESVDYNSVTYSVTSIGSNAFYGCSGLTSITIPNSVTSIWDWAFYRCTGLTSITIPNSVTSIGGYAFDECSGLTSIVVASGNTTYDSRENCNAIIETSSNTLIAGCQNTIIPNSVTSIGEFAFFGCSGLTSITIPNSVTSIGNSAFYWCTGLTSIEIPNSVTSIGYRAFEGCYGLTSITCHALMPPTCGYLVFNNVDKSIPLYVPEESIEDYQAAEVWKDFTNIQAIAETQSIGEVTNNQSRITNKIIKDNQIYILTGDKTYTLTGQQLK